MESHHAPASSSMKARVRKVDDNNTSSMHPKALDLLQPLPLTSVGRPALRKGEVEVYTEFGISLYDHTDKTEYKRGRCSITTHRLFYIEEKDDSHIALFLPLDTVRKVTKEPGFLSRSPKLRLDLKTSTGEGVFLKLSFKDRGHDDFHGRLLTTLERRAWKDVQKSSFADKREVKRGFDPSDAGIKGILERQKLAQQESKDLAATAFTDLSNLMEKAKDVVGLIERYVDTQKTSNEKTTEGGFKRSESEDTKQLNSLMLDMGITSPVTRKNAGNAYFDQLARQLAEFLEPHMPKHGGIMTLSDIYCIFNRARGVELVSPDDLYRACMMQKTLQLGYHLRKFEGGPTVLQSDSHREDRVAERLAKMAQASSGGYITATDVSTELHVSFPLAWEYLKVAEKMEQLCRDDTFEGMNFYVNKFVDFSVS